MIKHIIGYIKYLYSWVYSHSYNDYVEALKIQDERQLWITAAKEVKLKHKGHY